MKMLAEIIKLNWPCPKVRSRFLRQRAVCTVFSCDPASCSGTPQTRSAAPESTALSARESIRLGRQGGLPRNAAGSVWLKCAALAVAACLWVQAEPVTAVAWSPHAAHPGCRMNMGPTGGRVWIRSHLFEVAAIDPGSPADGILRLRDLVLGAGGTRFSETTDSRMILGNAIGAAEAADGALRLVIRRDGVEQDVALPLPVTGPYADTWPYACAKSQRILHDACVFLREAQFPDGNVCTDGGIGTYLSGLLFLASGEPRFLDGARRAAYATLAKDPVKEGLHNWPIGYGGVLLAEYYLATGDANVLPQLQRYVDHLAYGQMQCGSWGHKGPAAVYGAMNQSGIVCAIAMSLAVECGLNVDRQVLARALDFYSRYAELGAVPYGDHLPGTRHLDDNGKSASAAVLGSLHPHLENAAAAFAQAVAASFWDRESGHTGGFFSMTWGPLAARMAGPDAFHTFMDYQAWYYNLSRSWRGELILLPYVEALTRFDDSSYSYWGGEFTAGGMALAFAAPQRKLRILGAPPSVFGAALDGELLVARTCYSNRRWNDFAAALTSARAATDSPQEKLWIEQLATAAAMLDESTEITAREIENAIAEGDPYRARMQFDILRRHVGETDPRIRKLAARIEDGGVKWQADAGERYYEGWNILRGYVFQTWYPYAPRAKHYAGTVPELRPALWDSLLPVAGQPPEEWGVATTGDGVSGKRAFNLDTTDYTALRVQVRSPRNAHTKIWLNGEFVAELIRGQRSGYAKIELDDSALALLRAGENIVEVIGTSAGTDGNALDIGLDGIRHEKPLPATPAYAGGALAAAALPKAVLAVLDQAQRNFAAVPLAVKPTPAIPEPLRLGESAKRFQAAISLACDALSAADRDFLLRSPVSFWRHQAGQSLLRRGGEGMKLAVDGLDNPDWRVRSACCDALAAMGKAADKGEFTFPGEITAAMRQRLVELLADDNAWVRCRAAGALGVVGEPDETAARRLAELARDDEAWVREAALGAIDRVTDDPQTMIRAAADALRKPSTSFAQAGRALKLIDAYGKDDAAVIPALRFAIEHPGEGMGSNQINDLMQKLADLDPAGGVAVPVLMKVAAGGDDYDRLQGNPPGKAIELLGGYGAKAGPAEPVLEAIAAGDNAARRDAAHAALEKIRQK